MEKEIIKILQLKIAKLIDNAILSEERGLTVYAGKIHLNHDSGFRNLLHYLSLRTKDLSALQYDLSDLAISSLSHSEAYTLSNLINIYNLLSLISGREKYDVDTAKLWSAKTSRKLLKKKTKKLFGHLSRNKSAHIMVTLPDQAISDKDFVVKLFKAGMNIARINLGQYSLNDCQKMIRNIKYAEKDTGKKCLIHMDLSGPKLRISKMKDKKGKLLNKMRLKNRDVILLKDRQSKDINLNSVKLKPDFICTIKIKKVLPVVEKGTRIFIDDGKVSGKVIKKGDGFVILKVEALPNGKAKLKINKGVNFPDAIIDIPALTREDKSMLPFAFEKANSIGYSFVKSVDDIVALKKMVEKSGREDLGVIIKIETKRAFAQLPSILLEAMEMENIGIMIARGDLAIEVGFSRISEVQEEILWICEAAHVPVIWATQVLEELTKKGKKTRAEVTDAAMAIRAECVMMNKGPFILKSLKELNSILNRMKKHQFKRRGTLRPLKVASNYFQTKKMKDIDKSSEEPKLLPAPVLTD
jgi:pyruvate kinase